MRGAVPYLLLTGARTRTALVPMAASLFVLLGVFADPHNEVGATWGLTALVSCALAAWLVGAVLAGEPGPQADMVAAALGGRRKRERLDLVLVGMVGAGLTVAFLACPMLLVLLGRPEVFDRAVTAGDLLAAALAHLCCGLLGGAIGVLFAPPRLTRRASAIAAVLCMLMGLVAVSGPLGAAGGPVAVAHALADARPGTVDGTELLACLSCITVAGVALTASGWWARRSG